MENPNNQNPAQPGSQPPSETNAPLPLPAESQPITPLSPQRPLDQSGSRKKLYLILLIVLVIAAAVAAYFLAIHKTKTPAPPASNKTSSAVLQSAKKQYFLNDSVAGYINYSPTAFEEVKATKLPTIPQADPAVNTIIVQANVVGFSDSGLYLYDLKANKTYRLTDGGGSPRIMSDHYLLYGFDTGSGASKQLGGKLLNLQTGQTQTVFSDAPEKVPGTICCSVSPDGFKAAFVQKDKISVWDIRTGKSTDYAATVNPIDPNFSRTSSNDYNTENSYATPAWLNNDTIIYTDKPADSPVDNQPAKIVDDSLYKLTLSDSKSTQIATNQSGIYDIYVQAGSTFVNEVPVDGSNSQISLVLLDGSQPKTVASNPGFAMVSPSALSVYLFSTMDGPSAYTTTSTQGDSPSYKTFNPHIPGITVSQILPRGWIDNDRMLLAELDTAGTKNHEYIAVYNSTTDKVEQYLQIN